MSNRIRLALRGQGGEPVDLWRTIVSHGVASLPPMFVDEEKRVLEITVRAARSARTVRVREQGRAAAVDIMGRPVSERSQIGRAHV